MPIIDSKRAFAKRARSAKVQNLMETLAGTSTSSADKLDLIDRTIEELIANPIPDGDDDLSAQKAAAQAWPKPKKRMRRRGQDTEEF